MDTLLKTAGVLLVALALFHAVLPGYFKWRDELRGITLLTRQIHYIHTFFIGLTLLLMGLLCLTRSAELLHTPLGRSVCLGFAVFWLCRWVIQFFGYSASHWRGKRLETAVHVVFALLWTFFTAVFALASWPR